MNENLNPESLLHKKVIINTINNGAGFFEPHKIYGPFAQDIKITKLPIGNKYVIPISNNNGQGANYIKLHFPSLTSDGNNSVLYVTFAKKNSDYKDGYRDFVSKITQDYFDDLKLWIDNGRIPSTSGAVRYRKLVFTSYGMETSQIQNSVSFEIRFNYVGANNILGGIGNGGFTTIDNIDRTNGNTTPTPTPTSFNVR
jgi:hypothetical protein